jgi:ABC-2 type transport system ATP-binding protein
MSRGMRQKLGLILAVAHEPRLLILDEPASGLDPLMQERLEDHLRGAARRGGTVFFSSHTLSEVERLCDRVAILREGRVVADETLANLRSRAARELTIRWREGAPGAPAPPEFIELHEQSAHRWSGTLAGPPTAFLRWLAGQPVEDFTLGEPDLESLFRRHYRREDGR